MKLKIVTVQNTPHSTDLKVIANGQTIQLNLADWQALNWEVYQKLKEFQYEI